MGCRWHLFLKFGGALQLLREWHVVGEGDDDEEEDCEQQGGMEGEMEGAAATTAAVKP